MITTEQSYELGMSPNEYYELERSEFLKLVAERGELVHTFTRAGEPARACYGIELFEGFLLTDDGEIVSAERWQLWNPPEQKRKPIKPSLRFEILKRDGYHCQLCGATAQDGAKLEIDHIVPVAKGGTNDPSNLQVLCRDCNAGKSDNML